MATVAYTRGGGGRGSEAKKKCLLHLKSTSNFGLL